MRTAGFVLAGGRSSRMGCDKALLPWGAHSLVEHIACKVNAAAGNVAVIGEPDRYACLGLECLPDLHPDLGPLAGLESALASERGDLNLILACDMPQIGIDWLTALLNAARQTGADCVITQDAAGRVHPLCGVYRTDCLPRIRLALDERRLRLQTLVEQMNAVLLSAAEPIWNVNTPQQWAAFQQRTAS